MGAVAVRLVKVGVALVESRSADGGKYRWDPGGSGRLVVVC